MAQKQAVRLTHIDPHRLADAVAQAIRRHFARLGLQTATDEQAALVQRVATAVEQLAAYAVHGEAPEQPVAELLQTIALPVWGRAADEDAPEFDRGTPEKLSATWVGQLLLTMRAAEAREKLARGKPITGVELATLADRSASNIRLAVAGGSLKGTKGAEGWEFSATEARKYLEKGSK